MRAARRRTVNQGCVVQTHLFHDRMLSMDRVDAAAQGRPSGPNSVILPAASIGPARYGRARVPGDAGRVGARQDPLDRQPDRPVGRRRPGEPVRVSRRSDGDDYVPGTATTSTTSRDYDLELDLPASTATGSRAGPRAADCVAVEDRRAAPRPAGPRRRKVSVDGPRREVLGHGADKLVIRPDRRSPPAQEFTVAVRYSGHPHAGRTRQLGRGRLGGARPTGSSSPASPTGRRPGSPATTGRGNKADLPDRRSPRPRPTTWSPTAWLASEQRGAGATTWVYEQAEPMATYLATVQIGRYSSVEFDGRRCRARRASRAAWSSRYDRGLRPAARDDGGVLASSSAPTRSPATPSWSPTTTWRSRSRRRACRSSAPTSSRRAGTPSGSSRTSSRTSGSATASPWRRWKDIWLHEGFACYAEWLWSEESGGPSAHERAARALARLRGLAAGLVLGDPGPELMFDDRVYKRGALLLHALRLTVGDDCFFECPARLGARRTPTPQSAPTPSSSSPGARTGTDLSALFDAWLNREALPRLTSGS